MENEIMTEFDLGKVVGDDGNGIASIELLSTSGLQKTYRITYTDGNHFDFIVTDGSDATVTIVTAWEETLSDSKVPSEKLVKNSIPSLTGYLQTSDVVDNLTSTSTTAPLSANQGKQLNTLIGNAITYINQ